MRGHTPGKQALKYNSTTNQYLQGFREVFSERVLYNKCYTKQGIVDGELRRRVAEDGGREDRGRESVENAEFRLENEEGQHSEKGISDATLKMAPITSDWFRLPPTLADMS